MVRRVYRADVSDEPIIVHEHKVQVMGAMMHQVSLKQGLRQWGERGEESAIKEMRQMHDLSAFIPISAGSLTKEERKRALR